MATAIPMPALSPTMTTGTITKWLKKEGDKVSSGEAVAEVETDKSNLEVEAYDDGFLVQIVVKEGESVKVGAPIAYIGEKGEKVAAGEQKSQKPGAEEEEAQAKSKTAAKESAVKADAPPADKKAQKESRAETPSAEEQVQKPATVESASKGEAPVKKGEGAQPVRQAQVVPLRREEEPAEDSGRIRASPLAKKMAHQQGLDLAELQGSGPSGRIVKRDVEAVMREGGAARKLEPSAAPVGRVEPKAFALSSMRRVIAQRMAEVKPGVPHFYLTIEIAMDEAMKIREEAKALESKVSVNDIIVKAAAIALRKFPKMNVSFQGDKILQFENVDVGIAVAIEEGLITPVIRDADTKGLAQLSAEARDLAERGRKRALKPQEYSGGALTVSNLGMYGIDNFIAVINPPQASILAVGQVADKPVVVGGQLVVRKMMTATLSGDHRAIDGALGAEYLKLLKGLLERPMRLLF
jgi:pyruvate dehydrogenase E2 component (dihydrolipoamide acetyltransferase)